MAAQNTSHPQVEAALAKMQQDLKAAAKKIKDEAAKARKLVQDLKQKHKT